MLIFSFAQSLLVSLITLIITITILCHLVGDALISPTTSLAFNPLAAHIQQGTTISTEATPTTFPPSSALKGSQSAANSHIARFLTCPYSPNPTTGHIRLPDAYYQNISMVPPESLDARPRRLFNPAILPLPSWAPEGSRYLVISRVVTGGLHQESIACFAEMCSADGRLCSASEFAKVGGNGGLRCSSAPIRLDVPPTPALRCRGAWAAFPDIPGFHDPRVFWSGKGEPLIIVNSASQYGCVGLWVVDLRTLVPGLEEVMNRGRRDEDMPMMSYPYLTEITRNPASDRRDVEKNWMLWFPNREEAYVQYDMLGRGRHEGVNQDSGRVGNGSENVLREHREVNGNNRGRTFAKLIGNGYTTPNLTDLNEISCFGPEHDVDNIGKIGHWHQGSNSLRLILCTRAEAKNGRCDENEVVEDGKSVHFAIMHRKFSNEMDLPLRYERFVVMWESRRPFRMLSVTKWPILMRPERANPWTVEENWSGEQSIWNRTANMTAEPRKETRRNTAAKRDENKKSSAYFSYTPSLAWDWKPSSVDIHLTHETRRKVDHLSTLGTGYLGDYVLIGIGLDDVDQAFARVQVDTLLQCMRLCPGISAGRADLDL